MQNMINIVLFEPEIPPNTGNIIRLAANTGTNLHLIEPLGFELSSKSLRRAGLDYHECADIKTYPNFSAFLKVISNQKIYACTTKGSIRHSSANFAYDDFLLFGPESRGLPENILAHPKITSRIRIPMQPKSRSLNLSNSVAVILYEALRQTNYPELI